MEDSTPGSTENQTPGAENASQDITQQGTAENQQVVNDNAASTTNDNSVEESPANVQDDGQTENGEDQNQDKVEEWAKKQGIDLENPTPEQTKALAKRLRDTQKSFHEANSKAKLADTRAVSDLFTEDEGDEFEDPALKEVRQQSAKVNGQLSALAFREFVNETPEARELAPQMIQILQEEEKNYGKEAARLLSNNHARLFTLAKAASLDDNTDAAYDSGRKDERENLAKAQQAAGPASAAVSSAPNSQRITDADIGKMSTEEYKEWRKTNDPFATPLAG